MKNFNFIAALLSMFVGVQAQAQVIDTTPTWNGVTGVASFGELNFGVATFGQVFKTPVGFSALDSFTFWLKSDSGPDGVDFAGYVMEWNDLGYSGVGNGFAAGPVLYQSSQRLLALGTSSMTPFTFNTGGLTLDPSRKYIAFLSASNFFDGSFGLATIGYVYAGVVPGGDFHYNNNGSDFGALSTTHWIPFLGYGTDAAFRATFSSPTGAVPEPATYGAMGGIALIGLAVWRRRSEKRPG